MNPIVDPDWDIIPVIKHVYYKKMYLLMIFLIFQEDLLAPALASVTRAPVTGWELLHMLNNPVI